MAALDKKAVNSFWVRYSSKWFITLTILIVIKSHQAYTVMNFILLTWKLRRREGKIEVRGRVLEVVEPGIESTLAVMLLICTSHGRATHYISRYQCLDLYHGNMERVR